MLLRHHYAPKLCHPEEDADDAAADDDDDQVSSPPAKKPRTSDPDTSQCACAFILCCHTFNLDLLLRYCCSRCNIAVFISCMSNCCYSYQTFLAPFLSYWFFFNYTMAIILLRWGLVSNHLIS